ncbi:MAG: hypothetical protein GY856_44920 [bacterium]|nr:hypothetical protein [bacterium]
MWPAVWRRDRGVSRARIGTLGTLLLLLCAPIAGQEEEFIPEEDASESAAADFSAIDDLLRQDADVLANPSTYSYDPGARRDPFRSLATTRDFDEEVDRERPPGPGGLLIDEIEVEGVFMLVDGPVAQVLSASQDTSFLLRPGDQLWDGDVVSISLDEVIFKQSVNDPTALKPFREVVKRLNP